MSVLEQSINTMISVFRKYAEKQGDKLKLNKVELKSLLMEQFPCMEMSGDNHEIDGLMATLDQNRDGEVDFTEFAKTVAQVAIALNEYFHQI